jgi:hypothetical protein
MERGSKGLEERREGRVRGREEKRRVYTVGGGQLSEAASQNQHPLMTKTRPKPIEKRAYSHAIQFIYNCAFIIYKNYIIS